MINGVACPVCGSTVHPSIAAKPENAPTKTELDELQDKAIKANNDSNTAREAAGSLKGAFDEKEKSVIEDIEALLSNRKIYGETSVASSARRYPLVQNL